MYPSPAEWQSGEQEAVGVKGKASIDVRNTREGNLKGGQEKQERIIELFL